LGFPYFPTGALSTDRNGAKKMGPSWGHGFGREAVELLLAHSEKNATVAAYSHMELAADRKRALQYPADRVEAWPRA
jgi:hypothetical protein